MITCTTHIVTKHTVPNTPMTVVHLSKQLRTRGRRANLKENRFFFMTTLVGSSRALDLSPVDVFIYAQSYLVAICSFYYFFPYWSLLFKSSLVRNFCHLYGAILHFNLNLNWFLSKKNCDPKAQHNQKKLFVCFGQSPVNTMKRYNNKVVINCCII